MQYKPQKSDPTPDEIRKLVMRVTEACLSLDLETNLKGQVGRELIGDIIAFQRRVIHPTTGQDFGEIDVETAKTLIEVTNESDGLLQKLRELKSNPLLNPEQKKVVLYAPHYSPQAARDVVEEGIPVIQSLERLSGYIKKVS